VSTPGISRPRRRNLGLHRAPAIILADLEIGGKPRKVLMQAPKNGFFYVIDRETGEFISGAPYAFMTWAKGLDPKTAVPSRTRKRATTSRQTHRGRPRPRRRPHWHPMSYSPQTRLAYFPVMKRVSPSSESRR
jgi:glucose dehydrogenase